MTAAVCLFVPASSLADSASPWFWQNPIPQGNDLLDMAFEPGGLRGWAVGRGGAFVDTESAGALWATHLTPPEGVSAWRSVAAPSAGVVWVVDVDGVVWRSTDAGASWREVSAPSPPAAAAACTVVRFRGTSLGWLGTKTGEILITRDGGATWAECPVPAASGEVRKIIDTGTALFAAVDENDYHYRIWRSLDGERWTALAPLSGYVDMDFVTPRVGVVVTGTHSAACTADGGQTWVTSSPPIMVGAEEADANLVWAATDLRAYIFTNRGRVLRSGDGGAHWTRSFHPVFLDRYGATIGGPPMVTSLSRQGSRTFLFGRAGAVMYSTDDGSSYQSLTADFTDDLLGVGFTDDLRGVAVTHGALLVTADGGSVWRRQAIAADLKLQSVAMAGPVGWAVGYRWAPGIVPECLITRLRRVGDRVQLATQEMPTRLRGRLYDVWTSDGVTGWAAGADHEGAPIMFKTSNSGATWRRVDLPDLPSIGGLVAGEIVNVRVFADGAGWALVRYGCTWLLRTDDGGESWEYLADGPSYGDCLGAIDGRVCFIGMWTGPGDALFHVTRDGGETWTQTSVDFRSDVSSYLLAEAIKFADSQNGALAVGGALLVTDDGGETWDEVPTRTAGIYDIAWHGHSAWAVGMGGTVLYNGGEAGDFRPPITRSSVPTGWYGSDATVYLAPNDQCGVRETWWSFGDATTASSARADAAFRRYTGPIKVRSQGITPITAYSVDIHGNRESPRVYYVRVDKKRPWTKRSGRRIARYRVRLRLRAFDRLSGAKSISYKLDKRRVVTVQRATVKVTVKRRGKHVLRYWATDRAGHRSRRITVRIVVR